MGKILTIKTGPPLRLTVKYYDFDVLHPPTGAFLANLNEGTGL